MRWRVGTVLERRRAWAGTIEYAVAVEPVGAGGEGGTGVGRGGEAGAGGAVPDPPSVRALGYLDVVGSLDVGDRVLLNTSALERGLGTGGYAFVVAAPQALPADPPAGPGHIVKARYTPQQQVVLAVDEQESPAHEAFLGGPAAAGDLDGFPVLVADLHSALAPILCGVRSLAPTARIVYVMTDGGALPIAFSMTVAGLTEAGWLAETITVGQAYGGTHEAITLHSALLGAKYVLGADLAIVTQGPGNVGTGTPFGFTGLAAGEALNAVHTLGGRGLAALRVSAADPRGRHYGISHHSRTAYGRVVLGRATLVVPGLPGGFGELVDAQADELARSTHNRLTLAGEPVDGLDEVLTTSPVALSSMGRGFDADREYFLANAAAGRYAARLLLP